MYIQTWDYCVVGSFIFYFFQYFTSLNFTYIYIYIYIYVCIHIYIYIYVYIYIYIYIYGVPGLSYSTRALLSSLWHAGSFFFTWRIIALQKFAISVKPQHESAIGIHTSPPFWTSLPSPSPSHPSRLIQRPCLSFQSHTANSCWLSILHIVM